jgi:hypothetical protein
MDTSIFMDKKSLPTDDELRGALVGTYEVWKSIEAYVQLKYPGAMDEWNYSGEKYGWSFRIKDKKRAIVYLLPREGYFKAAFVFGQKATDKVMSSPVSSAIKEELASARVYAEGRGIRIDIRDEGLVNDIKELIDIKITA